MKVKKKKTKIAINKGSDVNLFKFFEIKLNKSDKMTVNNFR